jgi:hypothetical protein
VYQLTDLGLGGRIQAWSLTAAVWLRGNVTGGAVAAQEFLDTGQAGATDVGNGLLRAESTLTGMEDFLSLIHRIASHAR